jgi:asparagine synthase (glutamine-hydrolysing)
MKTTYLGRVVRGPAANVPDWADGVGGARAWGNERGDTRVELRAEGIYVRLFDFGSMAVLLRGYVADAGGCLDPATFVERVRQHYARKSELHVVPYDGAFTIVLLDSVGGRALLYRSPLHPACTYYGRCLGGMAFGENLADMVHAFDIPARSNTECLPAYFLFRAVPGRETLFQGLYRLLGGELVTLEAEGMRRVMLRPLDMLVEGPPIRDAAEQLFDGVMEQILRDCRTAAGLRRASNMLSGGVDSSLIQAIWCRAARAAGEPAPASCCVELDHPRTQADSGYAASAARILGSRHMCVPALGPYERDLLRSIVATGEVPNHVQTIYKRELARTLVADGTPVGVTGWGADGLFGNAWTTNVQMAQLLRTTVPSGLLRRLGRSLATALGRDVLPDHFLRAEVLDDEAGLAHPMNQIATFTTWSAIEACFGRRALEDGAAKRRALVEVYRVPGGPIERTLACDMLSEGMEQASLWTGQFALEGGEMFVPFFDLRMLRFALNLDSRIRFPFRRPKQFLRDALVRNGAPELARRDKRGFGQPIFEWLAPGGALRPFVDRIGSYGFVDRAVLTEAREQPNWFLYTLLCYDLWHKHFIEGLTLEQIEAPAAPRRAATPTTTLAPV